MRLRTLAILAAVPLAGCYPFVSTGTFQEAFCALDEDGDGAQKCTLEGDFEREYDCDDTSPIAALRSPDLAEIPYDGIDNDCDGEDELDLDNDDYPGISKEDYDALGGLAFPSDLEPEFDCNDQDNSIFPGENNEVYYNGIDENCDGKCDYDADEDGYADAVEGVGNDCGIEATDCLDSDSDVFPDAAGEAFYDGFDQDCDGINDYDPDEDGYAWPVYQTQVTNFLDRHSYDNDIVAFTDCYDTNDSPLTDLLNGGTKAPITVNGGVAELFYDGVDGNCSDVDAVVENDFDLDGDGYMRTADRDDFLAYVDQYVSFTRQDGVRPYEAAFKAAFGEDQAAWADYFDAHDNDCNDADPAVLPGAMEILGDSVDQDCDGDNNTSPFRFADFVWEGVGNPVVRATDTDFVVAALATESITVGTGSTQGPRVFTFSFELSAGPDASPTLQASPSTAGSTDVFSSGLGMSGFSNGYYVGHGFVRSGNTRLRGAVAVDNAGKYSDISAQTGDRVSAELDYQNLDMRCDSATDTCWVLACDGDGVQFSAFTDSEATTGFAETNSGSADVANVDCFISTEAAAGTLTLNTIASSGSVSAWEVSGSFLNPAGSNPFSSFDLDHASSHGDWLVLGHESTGLTLWRSTSTQRTVLSSRATDEADVAFIGSQAYLAALGGSDAYLAFGNPTSSVTEVALPFADSAGNLYTPEHIAIEAAGDRAIVVVSGTDGSGNDVLGWMIVQTP